MCVPKRALSLSSLRMLYYHGGLFKKYSFIFQALSTWDAGLSKTLSRHRCSFVLRLNVLNHALNYLSFLNINFLRCCFSFAFKCLLINCFLERKYPKWLNIKNCSFICGFHLLIELQVSTNLYNFWKI